MAGISNAERARRKKEARTPAKRDRTKRPTVDELMNANRDVNLLIDAEACRLDKKRMTAVAQYMTLAGLALKMPETNL